MSGIDSNTVLCLHADSSGNADASASGHTQTAHGSASISSTQSEFGGASMKFTQSTGDYYTSSNSADFDFGAGDFTIDWWAYEISGGSLPVTHIARDNTTTIPPFILSYNGAIWMSSNFSAWDIAAGKTFGAPIFSTWNHLAISRQGGTFYTFRNGVLQDTWTSSLAFPADTNPLSIGACQGGASYMNGYIDELRVSKGIARWTANFTPPTLAYSAPPPTTITYGTVVASAVGSGQSHIDLIDTATTQAAHYQIEFDNAVSDIDLIPSAGAALTIYVSYDGGVTFKTDAHYMSVGQSNFAGESNSLYQPEPYGFGVPQNLEMGFRVGVDAGDYAAYGLTGRAEICSNGGATIYNSIANRGAIGGPASNIRATGTLPAAKVGQKWLPSDGSQYFHWCVPVIYTGHYDGNIAGQPNAFRLKMDGAGNPAALIAGGKFRLRRMD